MAPKTLKKALETGYQISRINYAGSNKVRVDCKPRFYSAGMAAIVGFWISKNYIKRTYPNQFEAKAVY